MFRDTDRSSFFTSAAVLFSIEGFLLQFTGAINNFGNNLFATALGATDTQIGLTQMIPNLLAMLLLLPLGILADKVRNIRTVPLLTLAAMAFGYFTMSCVPMADTYRIPFFYFAIAFTMGGSVLYNAQWQNFFGEVVVYEERNRILTHRNRFMSIVGIIAPVICGFMLNQQHGSEAKLHVFQFFFFLCAIVAISQMLVLLRIQTPARTVTEKSFSLRDVTDTVYKLSHSRDFLLFFIPIVFFYMVWQMDWTMWYIGQTRYLGLNETDLSISNGVFNIGQLFAIGIFSRMVQKKGNDFVVCFGALGIMLCPVCMLFTSLLPNALHLPVLTLLLTVCNAGQCVTSLCIVQILLRVSPVECRSLAVSLYTLTITLTNSFMPYVGVRIYTVFGANHTGFVMFFLIAMVLRLLSLAALISRYLYLRKLNPEHKL